MIYSQMETALPSSYTTNLGVLGKDETYVYYYRYSQYHKVCLDQELNKIADQALKDNLSLGVKIICRAGQHLLAIIVAFNSLQSAGGISSHR